MPRELLTERSAIGRRHADLPQYASMNRGPDRAGAFRNAVADLLQWHDAIDGFGSRVDQSILRPRDRSILHGVLPTDLPVLIRWNPVWLGPPAK